MLRGRERRLRIPFYFPLRNTVDGRLDSLPVLGSQAVSTLLEMIRVWWHVSPPQSPPNVRETSSSSFSLSPRCELTQKPHLAPAFVGSPQLGAWLLLASPFSLLSPGPLFPFHLGRQWMRGHLLAWTPGYWQGGTLRTAGGLAALPTNHTAWAPEPMTHRWVSDTIWGGRVLQGV